MAEYIDKQEVIDYLNGCLHSIGERGADSLFARGKRKAFINLIQDISAVKAADVQPVRHGRWIKCDYKRLDDAGEVQTYIGQGVYCSKCRTGFHKNEVKNWIGCPCCLTRMDGDIYVCGKEGHLDEAMIFCADKVSELVTQHINSHDSIEMSDKDKFIALLQSCNIKHEVSADGITLDSIALEGDGYLFIKFYEGGKFQEFIHYPE